MLQEQRAPLITIGIASYNYARYLPRAFEAIKRQTFHDFEILYCDDGSTDDSIVVINTFIRDNPEMQIRLIAGENLGVMGNKNRILDHANGQYIMLCDADDWMKDDCLQRLAQAVEENPGVDRVISQAREVDEQGNVIGLFAFTNPPCKWAYIFHHGCLYKKELIDKHHMHFAPDFYPDDFFLVTWYNVYAQKNVFLFDFLYCRVSHRDSTYTLGQMNLSSPWFCVNTLRNMVEHACNIKLLLENECDKRELDFEVIKRYYSCISDVIEAPLNVVFRTWNQASLIMKEKFPQYRSSYYMKHAKGRPVSNQRKNIMRICVLCDFLHVMWAAILGFKILRWVKRGK